MAQKTYLSKELSIESAITNPKNVGLFGYRPRLGLGTGLLLRALSRLQVGTDYASLPKA